MDKKDLAKQALKEFSGQIPLKSKHVRWNYAPSEDNFDSDHNPYTRFYFAIVDNREAYRHGINMRLREILNEQNPGTILINEDVEFKVKDSEWKLLFVIYDARRNTQDLKFKEKGINAKRDFNFGKKKVLEIEDYLRRIYE